MSAFSSCTVAYLVNKPLLAAGISKDNVRGLEMVRKMNIWPRSEASRANEIFWGPSLIRGHYSSICQWARRGLFILYPSDKFSCFVFERKTNFGQTHSSAFFKRLWLALTYFICLWLVVWLVSSAVVMTTMRLFTSGRKWRRTKHFWSKIHKKFIQISSDKLANLMMTLRGL